MAGDGNMKAHVETYSSVTALLKWSAIASIVVALLVIWAIS